MDQRYFTYLPCLLAYLLAAYLHTRRRAGGSASTTSGIGSASRARPQRRRGREPALRFVPGCGRAIRGRLGGWAAADVFARGHRSQRRCVCRYLILGVCER
jgi:hypothetical protein